MFRLPRLGFALRLAAALLVCNLPAAVSAAPPVVPLAQPPAAPPPAPSPAISGMDPPPGCSFAFASKTDETPQAINDNSTLTRTLSFSGLPPTLWQASVRTQISHTYAADLDMYLVGPAPYFKSATLTTDNGGGTDNVFANTQWDDHFLPAVTEASLVDNVNQPNLIPEGALGRFRDRSPNGDWSLVVTDDDGEDTGTLNSWTLELVMLRELLDFSSAFPSNNTNLAIPNPGTATSYITVTVPQTYLVNLTVQIALPHNSSGDLRLVLKAPNGYTTTLTDYNGGGFDDLYNSITFTDDPIDGPGPVTDAAYVNGDNIGQAQPEGAMAYFVGINPNGRWELSITDADGNGANGTGYLNAWQLGIYTGHCTPTYLPQVSAP